MVLRAGRLGLLAMHLHIGTMTWHTTQAKITVFGKFVRIFGRMLLMCDSRESGKKTPMTCRLLGKGKRPRGLEWKRMLNPIFFYFYPSFGIYQRPTER